MPTLKERLTGMVHFGHVGRGAIAAVILLSAVTYPLLNRDMSPPLRYAAIRPTPLDFGLYVTPDPEQNPIDPPERFIGFHTAVDYEILPGEESREVPVFAVCDGEVAYARSAEGYGGVIVQHCMLEGDDITVLYGHIDPASFTKGVGDTLERGEKIAILASAKSPESGDTRKHLHLGIHKGKDIVLLGYVQTEAELEAFIDPESVF